MPCQLLATHTTSYFPVEIFGSILTFCFKKMVPRVNPTAREVAALRRMHNDGKTTREIGKWMGMTSACVSYWLRSRVRRPAPTRTPPRRNAATVDARRKVVRRLARAVLRSGVRRYPTANAIRIELQRNFNIVTSKSVVLSDLRALKFRSVVRPKVCCLPPDHGKRLQAAKLFVAMPSTAAHRVVFSDEKIFTTNDNGWRRQYVEGDEVPAPRLHTRWPKGRCMVWACIGIGFRHLVILPEKDDQGETFRLNAKKYVELCLNPTVVRHLKQTRSIFQQDGAACHAAASTLQFLAAKGVEVLKPWPARSPDLNVIETLWAILSPRVSSRAPRDRDELVDAVQAEWAALDQATVDGLVASFQGRAASTVRNKGRM